MKAHAWNVPKKQVVLGFLANEIQTTTPQRWEVIGAMCQIANSMTRTAGFDPTDYTQIQQLKRGLGKLTEHEQVALEHSFYMMVSSTQRFGSFRILN